MIDGWAIVLFLHLLGAIVWVGGQLTLAGIVVPATRRHIADEHQRLELMRDAGKRYAVVAVGVVLPLQVITGLALAFHRGVDLGSFSSGDWGQLLSIKLVLVVAAVALAALHGVLAARERTREARIASMSGLATSLVVVLLGAALVSS